MKLTPKEKQLVKEYAKNLIGKNSLNESKFNIYSHMYLVTVTDTENSNSEHSKKINANSFEDAYVGYLSTYQNYYDLDNVVDTKKEFFEKF